MKNPAKVFTVFTKNYETALHLAAKAGHKKVCEILIPKLTIKDINLVTKYGRQHYILLLKQVS